MHQTGLVQVNSVCYSLCHPSGLFYHCIQCCYHHSSTPDRPQCLSSPLSHLQHTLIPILHVCRTSTYQADVSIIYGSLQTLALLWYVVKLRRIALHCVMVIVDQAMSWTIIHWSSNPFFTVCFDHRLDPLNVLQSRNTMQVPGTG